MADLNLVGESYAHSLIAAGKVDRTSPWSFDDATDGAKLLGKDGGDWTSYARVHLGIDRTAKDNTKGRFKYPFAKGEKLYRSGLIAIRSRAGQQSDRAIEAAAGSLLMLVDKPSMTSAGVGSLVAPFEYKFLDNSADGTFEGYGSVFGNADDYGDVITPGAFKDTLAQHKAAGTKPIMLLNHGGLPWGGQTAESLLPVGGWDSLSEDSKGLQARGHLINLDTENGKRLYGAMKDRQINGMSITYRAKDFTRGTKASEPRRTIKSVDLIEMGPVTFPANALATINEIKSGFAPDIKFLERLLRDAGGLSRTEAKALLADGYKGLPLRDAAGSDDDELMAKLVRATALLRKAS
jgi:HK97 family phage prohead protease